MFVLTLFDNFNTNIINMKKEENEMLMKTVGIHEMCETYTKVKQLQEAVRALTTMEELSPDDREALIDKCNELMGFLLAGETTGMICRMRTEKAVRSVQAPQYPPFTHPESRYDPVTRRYWLSEQEVNVIKAALGADNLEDVLPPRSRHDIN